MNILVINGSPRKGGVIETLTDTAVRTVPPSDSVEKYRLYDLNIAPCRGCMKCRTTGKCSLPQDDGHMLANKFRQADFVVIGTPTYWSDMSAVVKNMFERLVYVMVSDGKYGLKPLLKGHRALIITACSAPGFYDVMIPEGRGAAKHIKKILHAGGYKVSSVGVTGTRQFDSLPEKYERKIIGIMHKTIQRLWKTQSSGSDR